MRLQPGFEQYGWRESDVFGLERAGGGMSPGRKRIRGSMVLVVVDENYFTLLDINEAGCRDRHGWQSSLAEARGRADPGRPCNGSSR